MKINQWFVFTLMCITCLFILFAVYIFSKEIIVPWVDNISPSFPRHSINEESLWKMETLKERPQVIAFVKGILSYNQGDISKAIENLQEVIRIKPNYMEAYKVLGYFYYKKGDFRSAEEAFAHALQPGGRNDDFMEVMKRYSGRFSISGNNQFQINFARIPLTLQVAGLNGSDDFYAAKPPLALNAFAVLSFLFSLFFIPWYLIWDAFKKQKYAANAEIVIGKKPELYLKELEEELKNSSSETRTNYLHLLQAEALFHVNKLAESKKILASVQQKQLTKKQNEVFDHLQMHILLREGKTQKAIEMAKTIPNLIGSIAVRESVGAKQSKR